MNKCFAGGHLRYVNGAWRDDNGDTVDAVSVVRCWDCIHLFSIIFGSYCQLLGKQMDKDDYCSYGERRKDNEID